MWRSPVKRISFNMSCPAVDKRKGNELVWHNDLVAAPRHWPLRHKKTPKWQRAVQYCRCFPNPFRCCSPSWPLPHPQVLQRVRRRRSSHLIIRPVNPVVTPEQILGHLFLFVPTMFLFTPCPWWCTPELKSASFNQIFEILETKRPETDRLQDTLTADQKGKMSVFIPEIFLCLSIRPAQWKAFEEEHFRWLNFLWSGCKGPRVQGAGGHFI